MSTPERRIALFLDFENLVTHTGISPTSFDLQLLLGPLQKKGRVLVMRAYADWSRFREAALGLHDAGVELMEVPPSSRAGKNSADIRLVIDAMEVCHARPHIDTFAIASGDSDFCPLATKLRENDRWVIGIAVKQAASPFLMKVCDEFIMLRTRVSKASEKAEAAAAAVPAASAAPVAVGEPVVSKPAPAKSTSSRSARPAPAIPPAVQEAVVALLKLGPSKVNPSAVKSAILRHDPAFSEKKAGFSTFAKLLVALEDAHLLRREQHGRQWYVLPPESPDQAPGAAEAQGEIPF